MEISNEMNVKTNQIKDKFNMLLQSIENIFNGDLNQ